MQQPEISIHPLIGRLLSTNAFDVIFGVYCKNQKRLAKNITREGVFRHMWMDIKLTDLHKCYIYSHFPNLWELYACIREFRNVFKKKSVILLYLFIEK